MRSLLATLALLGAIALPLGACGGAAGPSSSGSATGSSTSGEYPKTVENCGHKITLDKPPKRVISVSTEVTSLIATAGGADRIVARYAEYGSTPRGPAVAAKDAPILAATDEVSAEQLIGTRADLEIMPPGYTKQDAVDRFAAAGIPTLFVACLTDPAFSGTPKTVDVESISADLTLLGEVFGTRSTAASAVASLRERVAAVTSKTHTRPNQTAVFLQIYSNVLYNVSPAGSPEDTQLKTLGLKNLLGDVHTANNEINAEKLVDLNPDVIILEYGFDEGSGSVKTFEQFKQDLLAFPGVSAMAAVKNNKIIGVNVFNTSPDQFIADGIEEIARELDETK